MELSNIKLIWFFVKNLLKNPKLNLVIIQSYFAKRLRLSFAYLYRIELDGKFLLIKGDKIQHQYQPVGGVYKYKEGAKDFLIRISYEDDRISYNGDLKNDLRIYIPGKKLIEFFYWFKQEENREISYQREFKEELIDSNILDLPDLFILEFKKVKSYFTKIHYSPHFNCKELLYADIIIPEFNENQLELLKKIKETNHEKLKWVREDQIRRHGYDYKTGETHFKISENSEWLLN